MSCHAVPDTMISPATRFYSLAITLPHGTACRYCLEHTCQIKEQLMHLIFNYCLVLQTPGECQSEQSCLGETKLKSSVRKWKHRNKICIGHYSFLFSHLTIHSYKIRSPQSWIIHYFFFLQRKKSAEGMLQIKTPGLLVFVHCCDWWSLDPVKAEFPVPTSLSLTGSDRKEGASHASLAQREMFALQAEHAESHLLPCSHTQ